jgi:hypothetical protein
MNRRREMTAAPDDNDEEQELERLKEELWDKFVIGLAIRLEFARKEAEPRL